MNVDEVRPGKSAVERALMMHAGSVLAREVESLRADVARVRSLAIRHQDAYGRDVLPIWSREILRALDGEG
jgi:hypothetical protein